MYPLSRLVKFIERDYVVPFHSNLSTTSRYLNINRRGLHIAMQNFDASRTPVTRCRSGG